MPHDVEEVYIGVGSNVGSRIRNLLGAVDSLSALATSGLTCSRVYETKPVGLVEQPDFLNLVVQFGTYLRPVELLSRLAQIEQIFGRERSIRFGPRTLDLDILLYGRAYICFRHLQVPHPRMWERGFVMVPLADLAPGRRGPGNRTFREMAQALSVKGDIRDVGRFW